MVGVGTLIVAAALYFMLISPQFTYIRDKKAKAVDKADEVEKATRLKSMLSQNQADLDKEQKRLGAVEDTFASGDLYSWIILTVNKFKNPYKVEIPQFSREEKIVAGVLPDFPYDAVRYTVRGSGYYHDIGRFIADFENQFPYMRIQNLEVEPGEYVPGGDREKLAFHMEIVALRKPDAKPTAATAK